MLDFLGQSEAVGAWNLNRGNSKAVMDYSSSAYVDTSLDLNSKPLRLLEDTPNKEVQSKFIDFGKKLLFKDESGALVEELSRVSAENKKLTEMLTVMCEKYNELRSQMAEYVNKSQAEKEPSPSKKRKSESSNNTSTNIVVANNNGNSESSSTDEESFKKPREEAIKTKIWKSYLKTEASDSSLIVKDGYQWRKYGQKVTRDNPSPRAYFKCSFAPGCCVKKKVQRSVEDQTVVVATYEGEHNHPKPSQAEPNSSSNRAAALTSVAMTSQPKGSLDFAKSRPNNEPKPNPNPNPNPSKIDSPDVRQFLVEQMASSLTKDPNFTAALAAAISGRIYDQREKW